MSGRSCSVVMLGVLGLAAAAAPAWADLKIGVVQYARLMQESPQAKAAQETLRGEFAGKQKELQGEQAALKAKEDSLQKDGATMTIDQRTKMEKDLRDSNRELSEKVQEYQDDFNARQNEELSKLQKALVEEVQAYAQGEKFDLVLADGVIFTSPALDITPQVLAALQAHAARASTGGASGNSGNTGSTSPKPATGSKSK
ncbi:MAG TPA: OmpH family outer membrane protein [Steroidobacteraceae bacterium]